MNEYDETRLRDMLDAARKAQEFIADKSRERIHTDDMLAFAVVRAIEITGEAASRVSQETRDTLPQIEWRAIIGMRNRIIHDYVSVNLDVVWDVATHDLPRLIVELERLLPPEEE